MYPCIISGISQATKSRLNTHNYRSYGNEYCYAVQTYLSQYHEAELKNESETLG